MFDDIAEAPKREGFRGFVGRHFGPANDLESATEELQKVSGLFSGLGLFSAVAGAFALGLPGAIDGAVVAILALIVRLRQSRVAAGLLVLFATINFALRFPNLFAFVWVLFSFRGLQLALAVSRFRKLANREPADPQLPPGGDPTNPYRLPSS